MKRLLYWSWNAFVETVTITVIAGTVVGGCVVFIKLVVMHTGLD